MNDISTVSMFVAIGVSLAILVVPGVLIESCSWWIDHRRHEEEMRLAA